MEFFTAVGEKRPVRLSEATRKFAFDSLNHKYGKDTARCYSISFDADGEYAALDDIGKYDAAIRKIALESPIRICEGELLSGAATLGASVYHGVPTSVDGVCTFSSVSHLTVDFPKVLRIGFDGIRKEVELSLSKHTGEKERRFLESCLSCIDSLALWHGRYIEKLCGLPEYKANLENLKKVPFAPAETFYEAVQSLWFTFAFLRLCGNWPGIGRLDVMLGDYLKCDLENGNITLDKAREILAHFFIKGCEWITGDKTLSGDAQHYQNIVLSGTNAEGRDVTNEVTYLVLDIIEETGIGDFPTAIRIHKNTSDSLLRRIAEVISFGGGVVAVYGESTVIGAMTGCGYSEKEAVSFANDGCWETQVPGKTYFSYVPFDALQLLQKKTLDSYSGKMRFCSFEELFSTYLSDLKEQVLSVIRAHSFNFEKDETSPCGLKFAPHIPCTVVSLLEEGCIEKGKSYLEGGPIYNVLSPHLGGIADAVNALYVLKKLVFDEKRISFEDFSEVLKNGWEGNEPLRRYVTTHYSLYGNDNDEVDKIYSDIIDAFYTFCLETDGMTPYRFLPGISTFGRQIEWAENRLASPHGKFAKEVLAGNTSPTPGTDTEGASAVVKSYCKADLTKTVTGTALDIHLLPSAVSGEEGISALCALIRGFETLGGYFMQIDVIDAQVLKEAKKHPENYTTLSVRISGWNARFVTLSEEWQDMIIERYEK